METQWKEGNTGKSYYVTAYFNIHGLCGKSDNVATRSKESHRELRQEFRSFLRIQLSRYLSKLSSEDENSSNSKNVLFVKKKYPDIK